MVSWMDDFTVLCAQECELVLMGDINIVILDGLHTAPSAWQDIIDGHQSTLIVIIIDTNLYYNSSVLCFSVPALRRSGRKYQTYFNGAGTSSIDPIHAVKS